MGRQQQASPRERFALRLKMARERKYQTATAAAEAIGLEAETYRRYERAETEPDISTLSKLAEVFDVSTDYLIRGDLPSLGANA